MTIFPSEERFGRTPLGLGLILLALLGVGCVRRPSVPKDLCNDVEKLRAEATMQNYLLQGEVDGLRKELVGYEELKKFHAGLLRLQRDPRVDK